MSLSDWEVLEPVPRSNKTFALTFTTNTTQMLIVRDNIAGIFMWNFDSMEWEETINQSYLSIPFHQQRHCHTCMTLVRDELYAFGEEYKNCIGCCTINFKNNICSKQWQIKELK